MIRHLNLWESISNFYIEYLPGATSSGALGMIRAHQVDGSGAMYPGTSGPSGLQQASAVIAAHQTLDKDSGMAAIMKAMQKPDSGLEVRDRVWLKMKIPNAFLGSDMVDWLLEKVEGFEVCISLYLNFQVVTMLRQPYR